MKLRCKTYFAAGRRIIRAGDLLDPADPIVKGREHLFDTIGEAPTVPSHVCDECGFEARSAAGLGAHVRSHDGDDD